MTPKKQQPKHVADFLNSRVVFSLKTHTYTIYILNTMGMTHIKIQGHSSNMKMEKAGFWKILPDWMLSHPRTLCYGRNFFINCHDLNNTYG